MAFPDSQEHFDKYCYKFILTLKKCSQKLLKVKFFLGQNMHPGYCNPYTYSSFLYLLPSITVPDILAHIFLNLIVPSTFLNIVAHISF